ncbi:MAG: dioxygenase [Candidatus Eremiobacteraeota bacterium]|nr:dioxygenase [Candidatus Eremiobacteraeota bacterium]
MSLSPCDALPTYFISHGGGPCFDMEWPSGNPFARLQASLSGFAAELGKQPRALLVVSAHWEESVPTVTAHPKPPLIYDYTGFPAHTYALRYDVPGSPELAACVRHLLGLAGVPSAADATRGLDHGVFVPFRVMYPAADVPLVQLSLVTGYDPARHMAIGAALAPLRNEGVLIVGSGMSFHNLERFFDGEGRDAGPFDAWLTRAVTGDPDQRAALLERWLDAPSARLAHPEEDHLAPLFVAAGAAPHERGVRNYADVVLGKHISGYRFGEAVASSPLSPS